MVSGDHDMPLLLQRKVRDARAGYMQSLDVLMSAKECGVYTKSSIMLGLGETDEEIIDTMLDLKDAGKRPLSFSVLESRYSTLMHQAPLLSLRYYFARASAPLRASVENAGLRYDAVRRSWKCML